MILDKAKTKRYIILLLFTEKCGLDVVTTNGMDSILLQSTAYTVSHRRAGHVMLRAHMSAIDFMCTENLNPNEIALTGRTRKDS